MNRNTEDIVYAVKDKDDFYFIGYNQWDKQVRKARLYRSYKLAQATVNESRFVRRNPFIVKVKIMELDWSEEE